MRDLELKTIYNSLFERIKETYSYINVYEIQESTLTIIVSNGRKNKLYDILNEIRSYGIVKSILLICQPNVYDSISDIIADMDSIKVIVWEGDYDLSLIDIIEDENCTDSFAFFGPHEVDQRDINLYKIGCELYSKYKSKIICFLDNGNICLYKDIIRFCSGVKLYNALELDIEKYLSYVYDNE